MNTNRFLYRNARWLYMISVSIRMDFWMLVGKIDKAQQIINEHRNW